MRVELEDGWLTRQWLQVKAEVADWPSWAREEAKRYEAVK